MSVLITTPLGLYDKNNLDDITIDWEQTDSSLVSPRYYSLEYKKPGDAEWKVACSVSSTRIPNSIAFTQLTNYMDEIVDFQEYYFRLMLRYPSRTSGTTVYETTYAYSDVWSFAFRGERIGFLKVSKGDEIESIPLYSDIDNAEITNKLNVMIDKNTKGQAPLVSESSSFASSMKTSHGAVAGAPRWDTRRGYANSYSVRYRSTNYYGNGYKYVHTYTPAYYYYYYYSEPAYTYRTVYGTRTSSFLDGYYYYKISYSYSYSQPNYRSGFYQYWAYTYSYYTDDGLTGLGQYYKRLTGTYYYADGTYYYRLSGATYYDSRARYYTQTTRYIDYYYSYLTGAYYYTRDKGYRNSLTSFYTYYYSYYAGTNYSLVYHYYSLE